MRSCSVCCEPGTPRVTSRPPGKGKELIRSLYDHENETLALEFITRLGQDFKGAAPPEVRSLGRTLLRWKKQILAWHQAHVTNGPTEAMNNLIKRVKRAAFGFRSFRNCRVRALLYAGKPNWDLLTTVTPGRNPKSQISWMSY